MDTGLEKLLHRFERPLIAIDGRCGCGKSSLGAELAAKLHAPLFHMDDFYLPFAQRSENWRERPAGNMDLERFRREVLEPLRCGESVLYLAYCCPEDSFLPERVISPGPAAIIEGSYSHHPLLADYYDLKLFVTANSRIQQERLRRREGSHYSAFKETWIPMEELYFETFDIEAHADCLITTDTFPPAWHWMHTL